MGFWSTIGTAAKDNGKAWVNFATFGAKGATDAARNAAPEGKGMLQGIANIIAKVMNKSSEMLTARKADGSRSALGSLMQPILYILAAIGIYKGVKALVNYFDVRSERKKVEKVGEAAMLNAESMERMANAQAMEIEAARIASTLPQEVAQESDYHQKKFAPERQQGMDFRQILDAQKHEAPTTTPAMG